MKQRKVKEPIRVRLKTLADGSQSVYLDQYVNGQRNYEFLRLYLIPERDAASRERNRETMRTVNAIKARRIIELTKGKAGLSSCLHSEMPLADFLAWHVSDSRRLHRGDSYAVICRSMAKQLRTFLGPQMDTLRMKDIDVGLCRRFISHLQEARKSTGLPLSKVSIHHYFCAFRSVLAAAVAEEVIGSNPADRLKRGEKPARPVVMRDHLDADEVAVMARTPCSHEEVKRAFLFSCLTGLRISDVRALRWENIRRCGDAWRLSVVMKKTQEPITCKLSQAAVGCLGKMEDTGRVFELPATSSVERAIARWAKAAGITKHVTFHTSRHSYATMALTAGTDLYTISRLLGHRNVATTTVYAAVVDEKRDAAVDSVCRLFQKEVAAEHEKR